MPDNILMARLRAYTPNASLLGSLPHPLSWEAGMPLNDMPSLTLTYPVAVASISTLLTPCEVALEIRSPDTGEYIEHPGCRFLNLRRTRDLIERPDTVSLTMPSYGWQLRKVRFIDSATMNEEGRRPFTDATPGFILTQIIDEAKARGNIPGLVRSFTETLDSNGAAWSNTLTAEYDLGQDAWSMLDTMSRQGLVDWRFNGRQLDVYNPDTVLRRNLDGDGGLIFHPTTSHLEEPSDRTWEEVAPTLLLIGDENASFIAEADPGTFDSPWGLWEETFTAGGVSNQATLQVLAQRILQTRSQSRLQLTKRLVWREGSPVPLLDYRPGDVVRARTDDGTQTESVRIHQITLTSSEEAGITIGLTLNDRFTDRALRAERWISRITNQGGPTEGGGSGANPKPPPPEATSREPSQPQNPSVTSTSYFDDDGSPVGQANLTFEVVTTGVDGEPLTPDRYNMYARRDDLPFDLRINAQAEHPEGATPGQTAEGIIGPLEAGFLYHFAVRAISSIGRPGDWSTEVSLVVAYPTDPPPIPSTPILSSRLSTVKVEWDGLDENALAMPARFREVQVELSLTGSAPWTHVGEIFQGGSALIVTGQDSQLIWGIGDTLWFRFRARDSASNVSDPGLSASIVVLGIEGPDIEANSITANLIAAGSITAEKVQAHSLSVDRLSVGDNANLVADPLLSDIGDPDPDNPGQTIGGLNRHREQSAEDNSATATTWDVTGGFAILTNNTTLDNFNRFPLLNNVVLNPDLVTPGSIERPGLTAQVTRPVGAVGVAGRLKGRLRVVFSLNGETMPGGAQTDVTLFGRFYDRLGSPIGFALVLISAVTFTTDDDVVIQSVTGAGIPEGTAGFIPYVHVSNTGGVPVGITVSVSEFEVWQESSVFIGDGLIRAPLIQADAITTDKLDATAITAKHTIQSALYIMLSQSGDPSLRISNNANFTGQAGIRWDGPANIEAPPRVFMVDALGTGGWDPNALVISGTELTTNTSGRVDIQLAFGETDSYMKRNHGEPAENAQGIYWRDNDTRFSVMGQLQSSNFTNDMFRGINWAQVGANTWTLTWGVTNWIYYPVATPGFVDTDSDPSDSTCLITRRLMTGIRIRSSKTTSRMNVLAFAGGTDL